MKKLFAVLRIALVCCCVGTVLAQAVAVLVLMFSGNFGADKRARLLAELVSAEGAAFGPPHVAARQQTAPSKRSVSVDQRIWSPDETTLRRQWQVAQAKQLETLPRELRSQHDQLHAESAEFARLLTADESVSVSSGLEEVQLTLAALRPGEAKTQLLLMLEDGDMEDVVWITMAAPLNKRGAIFNTFQTPAERERLNEILTAIRESGLNPTDESFTDDRTSGKEQP